MDNQELRRAVLKGLSLRGHDKGGYSLLEVEGATDDEVETMVTRLAKVGFVDAAFVEHGLGPGKGRVQPRSLTDKGWAALDDDERDD